MHTYLCIFICAGERQFDVPNDSAAAVVGAGQPFGTLSPASAIHRPLVRCRSEGAAHPSRVMTVPDRISAQPDLRQATRLSVAPHRGHTLLWQNTWCHPWISTCMHWPCDSRACSWPSGPSLWFTPSACGPGHLELSTPTRVGLVNYLPTHRHRLSAGSPAGSPHCSSCIRTCMEHMHRQHSTGGTPHCISTSATSFVCMEQP